MPTLSGVPLPLVRVGIRGGGVEGSGNAEETTDGVAAADGGRLAGVGGRRLGEGGRRNDAGGLWGVGQRRRLLAVLRLLDGLLRPLGCLVPHDPTSEQ